MKPRPFKPDGKITIPVDDGPPLTVDAENGAGWSVHRMAVRGGGFAEAFFSVSHTDSGKGAWLRLDLYGARKLAAVLRHRLPGIPLLKLLKITGSWRKWFDGMRGLEAQGDLRPTPPPKVAPRFEPRSFRKAKA